MDTSTNYEFGDRDPARPGTHFFAQIQNGRPKWRSDEAHKRQLANSAAWAKADSDTIPGKARRALSGARVRSVESFVLFHAVS